VPHVRRGAVDLPLLAVQGERVAAAVVEEEVFVEALPEIGRLALEALGERGIVPELRRESCAPALGVVDVALDLAGGDRAMRLLAVVEQDRVVRVLPALVLEAAERVARLVLDVAVPVEVAVVIDPVERGARVRLELADQVAVAGPALVLVEQDEEERGCVGRAVVGRVWPLAQDGQLAEPQFVQDLPGFSVAEIVAFFRL
jgi:hypothetical protein